jgi:hypothetical protein
MVVSRSAFKVFPEAVGEFSAEFVGHATGGALDFFDELMQVAARTGDGDDAEGCGSPGYGFIHFGDRDVEGLPELVLYRADHLAAVLERLGVLDAEFESELGYGHGVARPLGFDSPGCLILARVEGGAGQESVVRDISGEARRPRLFRLDQRFL